MSLSNQLIKNVYVANGILTNFSITFAFFDPEQVAVYLVDDSDASAPDVNLQVISTDYTLSGNTVIFLSAPASGLKVILARESTLEQVFDVINSGNLLGEEVEEQFDRIVMMMQELFARAVLVPPGYRKASLSTLPEPIANAILAFNATADGFTQLELAGDTLTIVGAGLNSDTQDIAASGTVEINADSRRMIRYVQGDGAAVSLDATTAIEAGTFEAQELILVGMSSTNTVFIDNSTADLRLNGDITLGLDDTLSLVWDDTNSLWREIARSV